MDRLHPCFLAGQAEQFERWCSKAYADLIEHLRISEVKAEKAWHARHEAGLVSWRTLRTQHAIEVFKSRIAAEWTQPEPSLALFAEFKQAQNSAYQVRAACDVSLTISL